MFSVLLISYPPIPGEDPHGLIFASASLLDSGVRVHVLIPQSPGLGETDEKHTLSPEGERALSLAPPAEISLADVNEKAAVTADTTDRNKSEVLSISPAPNSISHTHSPGLAPLETTPEDPGQREVWTIAMLWFTTVSKNIAIEHS